MFQTYGPRLRTASASATRVMSAMSCALAALMLSGCASTTRAPDANDLPPGSQGAKPGSLISSPIGASAQPTAPWRLALLPRQTKPVTDFSVVDLDGQRVLRVAASRSYGKLLYPVYAPDEVRARTLAWDWRVDRAPDADLRQRSGDDVALRVCAFFDWPIDRLPLVDRTRLVAAEALTGQDLPTAAICYVWDKALPSGTVMPNAFTRRLRMIVVDGEGSATKHWQRHTRDLHKDFRAAFADEWREGDQPPPVRAVVIGSDTDNTGGEGLSFVRAIDLHR
jgi:hypothetical protein